MTAKEAVLASYPRAFALPYACYHGGDVWKVMFWIIHVSEAWRVLRRGAISSGVDEQDAWDEAARKLEIRDIQPAAIRVS